MGKVRTGLGLIVCLYGLSVVGQTGGGNPVEVQQNAEIIALLESMAADLSVLRASSTDSIVCNSDRMVALGVQNNGLMAFGLGVSAVVVSFGMGMRVARG